MANNASVQPLVSAQDPNLTPETWPLDEILRQHVQNALQQLRVCMPAAVTALHGDQTVDLQPLLQVTYVGQDAQNLPVLKGVPVLMPQGGTWRVSYPVAVGDTGLMVVADRNLDTWLASQGGPCDPNDDRSHDLNDAVFVPGLVPSGTQTVDTSGDVVLSNGQVTLRLNPKGKLSVKNTAQELVQVLHDHMQVFIDTLGVIQSQQTLTAFGPAPLIASTISQLVQVQSRAQAVLANLDTFKV